MSETAEDGALLREAEWLETAHANSADKGYSAEYRAGFAAAAGWVRRHAEHGQTWVTPSDTGRNPVDVSTPDPDPTGPKPPGSV